MTTFSEKIGQFYLGSEDFPDEGAVLYDAADLTTHAVIIGMTGSGKTGLGVCLLEEAALDNIPVIAIDPKGDMGNLALNFPQLRAADFKPWADPSALSQADISADEWAQNTATRWRKGIEQTGQSSERMQALQAANPVTIYTPGSEAGVALSLLADLSPPDAVVQQDIEAYSEYLDATAGALLALLNVGGDTLAPEHIFLTHILRHFWDKQQSLSLADLIANIQRPPFDKIGVLALSQVFPDKSRTKLAMTLNNLLASPSFAAWLKGVPLDTQSLFYDKNNQAQTSVLNIAHLSDAERMFFVTLMLGNLINWMRRQSGTGTLRAILYMDEMFGYLPPTANPPSKALLLTLLKQARAYGLGLVLSTQNPIDLDYKALSNAGTWFIGRLQTAQDRARVTEGLLSASGEGLDKAALGEWFDRLGKRKFLLHNIHENAPCIFSTRWAMSYLAGPLNRAQLQSLSAHISISDNTSKHSDKANKANKAAILPNAIATYYFPSTAPVGVSVNYSPLIIAAATVFFNDRKSDTRHEQQFLLECPLENDTITWQNSRLSDYRLAQLQNAPQQPAQHQALPASFLEANTWKTIEKNCKTHIRQQHTLKLLYSPTLKTYSEPGESELAFRHRLTAIAHEQRDAQMMALRQTYAKKQTTLNKQLLTAETAVHRESAQASQSWLDAGMSIGSAVLGAFMGRKVLSKTNIGKVSTAMRRAGKISKERQDVAYAEEKYAIVQKQIDELSLALSDELATLRNNYDPQQLSLETVTIQSKASDIHLRRVALAYRDLDA